MTEFTWTDADDRAVDTARILAADAVEKVGNGHPGTAISLAPLAYLLYQKVMKGDPADPKWLGRDRFVLSIGHSSLTQYCQLFLAGYGLEVGDLASLRTEGSLTPGHPEFGHTKGVECTTGPLGAGVADAVGFAMAARRERALLDPTTPLDAPSVFDRTIFAIAGDGCMQEGVSSEASSLAGAQKLGNLVLIYDDNRISIEGETQIAFTEDVAARYAAYGWHVQNVDWTNGGTGYTENVQGLWDALVAAKAVTDQPSFIKLTTVIGWPLPTKAGHHSVHGSKLGGDEVAALKTELGFDPAVSFAVEPAVLEHTRAQAAANAAAAKADWEPKFEAWKQASPESATLLARLTAHELPAGFASALPVFAAGKKSTRAASGEVLSALADVMPELWGGSADLAGSNNTTMKGVKSFLPPEQSSPEFVGDYTGRTLHFGIREHAMGNIVNAVTMSGLTRCYGGTFLVFADYMRGAVRLAAIQRVGSIFVWSHDSVGVGEDGPTHQPIEHLASLRAIPGLDVIRPADANETAQAWAQALAHTDRPSAIILSRQDLLTIDRDAAGVAPATELAKGGYTLIDADGDLTVVIIATGSEVEVALGARDQLQAEGIGTRVVSMPCTEWFNKQSVEYRSSVLPAGVAKVSVEAGVPMGWREYVGDAGEIVAIDHFGESAAGSLLFTKFGFTAENVAAHAHTALDRIS
ncbi:MAG: transketolase [Propionicimonas sp.]